MYVAARPAPALAGIVRAYGGYDEASAEPVRRREVPSASCTLILAWAGSLDVDGVATAQAFLAGMSSRAGITVFAGRQAGVQVDLTPLGTLRLLGPRLDELADCGTERSGAAARDAGGRVTGLAELGIPALAALPARLAEDHDWAARFARVDATLTALLAARTWAPDPEVARAWSLLVRHPGRVPVAALAADVGWSRRHLLTRFRRQVGLSPTVAGRVLRFRRATELLLPGAGPDRTPTGLALSRVAADAGYADHSHLVREFRALSGVTPSAFLAERVAPADPAFPDVQDTAPGAP